MLRWMCLASLSALAVSAADATPAFEEIHVVQWPKAQWGYRGSMGNTVQLKDGRLLMCYSDKGVVTRISEDKGKTWGEQAMLVPNPPPPSTRGYYVHPSLFYIPNGDLLLSYIYSNYPPNEGMPYYGMSYYKRSNDHGKTWSEQFVMTPNTGYEFTYNDKPIVLSTGRILAPTEKMAVVVKGNDHAGYVTSAYYSDDNGYTWLRSENEVSIYPIEAQEPHVVELKDGRLLMLFRTYSGHPGRAFSEDKGKTWSQGEVVQELPMAANSSAITVHRIPSTGDLLLIHCTGGAGGKRTPLTSYISKDEGKTWTNPRNLAADPDDDYGYHSVLFLDDLALVGFHKRDGLYLARIRLEWFYGTP
jgi:sialidase-1